MRIVDEKISIIDPIADKRWDEFVEAHPNGWLCHLSGWKELLENCFSQMKGYYVVKFDDTKNNICAGMPVYLVKSFLTGKRLVSIPFATLCDPLCSDVQDIRSLSDVAIQLRKEHKASFIEIRSFNSRGLENDQRFTANHLYKHHYLELNEEPELLKKRFHRTCVRQRINRSLESNIQLKIGETKQDLHDFYSLYILTRKRTHLPPMPYRFFDKMWDIFSSSGKISLILAQHEQKAIAGIILFKYKNRVSAEVAASDDRYKNASPNHFLFWHAINMAFRQGYAVFDFGRTSIKNQSLLDFKTHWGTTTIDLPNFIYSEDKANDLKFAEDKLSYKIIKRFSDFIPQFAYQIFGDFCYRHLG